MKRLALLCAMASACGTAAAQAPMTLKQCIDYATERNVQVRLQENVRQQQEVALHTARHARLPEVQASGSQSFDFGRGLTSDNTYVSRNTNATSFGVNASVPLFTGFRLPNQKEQARLNLEAATADLQKLREDLGIQIAQAYLQVLYQQELKAEAEAQLELSRKQEARVKGLFEAQKASGVELSEARSRTAQDELSLVQADNACRLALLDLSQLIEMPSPDSLAVVRPEAAPPERVAGSPQEIYDLALGLRPAIRAGELRIESAERGIRIARSGYWPTLSLGAGLGTSYYHTNGYEGSSFSRQMRDNFTKNIGLTLSMPIFSRFQTRNAVKQARLEHESRLWQQEETRKELYKEIQQAWYNAVAAQQKYASCIAAEEAAQDAFRLMEKKYENGKANATEYDEARTKQFGAACERISALYEYLFRTKILDFYRGEAIE